MPDSMSAQKPSDTLSRKPSASPSLESIVSLCRRRGFVFPSSEIYGGINSCWDYGPLGAELKRNIKRLWWESMTRRADVVGLDSSIFMHPNVWKASGHLENFTDPLCDCKNCKHRFLMEPTHNQPTKKCPQCGSTNITEPRNFNLLFESFMGPVREESSTVYLRPETAQGDLCQLSKCSESFKKNPSLWHSPNRKSLQK